MKRRSKGRERGDTNIHFQSAAIERPLVSVRCDVKDKCKGKRIAKKHECLAYMRRVRNGAEVKGYACLDCGRKLLKKNISLMSQLNARLLATLTMVNARTYIKHQTVVDVSDAEDSIKKGGDEEE